MAKRRKNKGRVRQRESRIRRGSHEGMPSRDEFARRMMAAIRRAGETRPIRYDPEEFMLVSQGCKYRLANAFGDYCRVSDRASAFRNFVAVWFSHMKLPEQYEDVDPDLLPQIMRRTQYDASVPDHHEDGGEDHDSGIWPIADHLAVVAAYDLPESVITLAPWTLRALWGVGYEKALSDACANLLQISKEPFENPQPGVYVSPWRDNHDASRLLLIDRIRQLNVKGDHVAMVPNRDTLVVTGSGDSAGLATMAEIASATMDEPYPISTLPVRLAGDQWTLFMPDACSPSFRDFRSLRTRSIALDYSEQQEMLNLLLEKEGIYAASYLLWEKRTTREYISYCVWSEGAILALPRTDAVGFSLPGQPEGQRAFAADWDSVFSIAGEMMTPVDTYPERYLVKGCPTPDQLSSMGARSVVEYVQESFDRGDQGT